MLFHTERELRGLALPDIPTLIDPWMAAGSVSLVFGPPSAGKTLWLTTVTRALATGSALFGSYPCAKSRVLVVQADMPTVLYQERLQALPESALSDNIAVWLTENLPLDILTASRQYANIVAQARAFAPDVVFVDTLRKTHALDENDSAAPDKVYGAWRTLFPSASLVFLHHARKVSSAPVSADVAVREAFRGSIAWAASADSIIAIRRVRKKGSKDWLVQQRFVRTRGCEEPPPLLLRRNEALLLEPTAPTLENRLIAWLSENPRATQHDAMLWLTSLRDERGKEVCGRRRAYRIHDRVVNG